MNSIDFLAIGDTVTDAFIRVKDVRIDTDRDTEDRGYDEICFRFGDKIPYEDVVVVPGVGNPANAAVAASRLDLKTAFITDIGMDTYGDEIIRHFESEKINTQWVTRHKDIKTNYHFVLSFGAERTILIKHETYPYLLPKDMPKPKAMYFSSLGENSEKYHEEIITFTEAHPSMLFVFQPNTFQVKLGVEKLARFYRRADLMFANKEEFQRILDTRTSDVLVLLQTMHNFGVKTPILTDGRDGAYALENDEIIHVPMFPDPAPPVERTGAGDAFSSTTTAYVSMGMPLKEAMLRGTVNSAYVVQKIGAQAGLLTKDELEAKL